MGRAETHKFVRALHDVEEAVLVVGAPVGNGTVHQALDSLVTDEEAQNRVEALAQIASGTRSRISYQDEYGVAGIRRFVTAGGRTIYLLPIETFPGHVNNVYLVRERGRAFLFDAGSFLGNARADFARAARVLEHIHGENADVLETIEDVIISHAHMDHYGGVAHWKRRNARVHMHELDARVVTNFGERIVVAALALRHFLEAAGVDAAERRELEELYVLYKNAFRSAQVDRQLTDGAVVCGSLVHHVPGHCPGQICLQVDNILLAADHVLARITPHQAPESITPSTGLDHYIDSLEKIRRVGGIDIALPGHEEPITRLSQRISEIEAFHRDRLESVRRICDTPKSVREVAIALFGAQRDYGKILAYEEAGAHVEYLARRGMLEIANLEDFQGRSNPVVRYRTGSSSAA